MASILLLVICGALCDEYARSDSRVQAIPIINGGVSVARNACLNQAKGTYISFVDSDGYILLGWLNSLHEDISIEDTDAWRTILFSHYCLH